MLISPSVITKTSESVCLCKDLPSARCHTPCAVSCDENTVFSNDAPALILQDADKYGVTEHFEGGRLTRIDLCASDI
jgi:hypothetical protein